MQSFLRGIDRPLFLVLRSLPLSHRACTFNIMSAAAQTGSGEPAKDKPKGNGKKELKILMLHGYTQSGPLFNSKTKALTKLLVKAFNPTPITPVFIYPTGPHQLRPSDIPGFVPPEDTTIDADEPADSWAWFRKGEPRGEYRGFEAGMEVLAQSIRDAGGIDGVCGFSQGGSVTSVVAAALEKPYRSPPADTPSPSDPNPEKAADWSWVENLRSANGYQPLKFAVIYSGFHAAPESFQWLYEPAIITPTLHFIGSLDTVVEENRTQALADRCKDPVVVTHPGGHYVPVSKEWAGVLLGYLRKYALEEKKNGAAEESRI